MNILLVGPRHHGGSLTPYLDVLAPALRRHGARVHRIGSRTLPYDTTAGTFWDSDRIVGAATRLLDGLDLTAYDLISTHFGNLEIEQLLPALWADKPRPPVVHHVHSLDETLFTRHTPDPDLRRAVNDGVQAADGYVFFGDYARITSTGRCRADVPSTVAWLPTTIPADTPPSGPRSEPWEFTASLYGYAAPWKDAPTLRDALTATREPGRFLLAGPFWDDPTQAGCTLPTGHAGATALRLRTCYLDAGDRLALVTGSDVGVFPYRHQQTFQGSGAIADYLAHGRPVIASDIANMAELAGPAGIIIPAADPAALAETLDAVNSDHRLRRRLTAAAADRARHFTADAHAVRCLRLYHQVIRNRDGAGC